MSCVQMLGGLSQSEGAYPYYNDWGSILEKEDSRKEIELDEMSNFGAPNMGLVAGPGTAHTGYTFRKHHTMPELESPPPRYTSPLPSNTLKRSATTEEIHIARSQQKLDNILPRIEQGKPPTSHNVEKHPSIEITEYPVPTLFLEQSIYGPTTAMSGHYGGPNLGGSMSSKIRPQGIDDFQSFVTEPEDLNSILDYVYTGVKTGLSYTPPTSDSGLGSSMMSITYHSPKSASSHYGTPTTFSQEERRDDIYPSQGSLAKRSASHQRTYAAKLQAAPLTSAIAPTPAPTAETQPMLSDTALNTIKEIILEPMLKEKEFCNFWYICRTAQNQVDTGQIVTLRDLEKFLCHKAEGNIQGSQAYNSFCKKVLSRVQEALKYMPKNELLRCYDRPYDTGYFLDMKASFNSNAATQTGMGVPMASGELGSDFASFCPPLDKRPAEPRSEVESDYNSKRSKLSTPAGHIEVEFSRNGHCADTVSPNTGTSLYITPQSDIMATTLEPRKRCDNRRGGQRGVSQKKKQQLYRCPWLDCQVKEFTRQCDLTKHEKTHTRPHKCTTPACQYYTLGFPNEKERDRHINDKHSPNAAEFICEYSCGYKSRRESNCKQHMEKAHGYKYVRSKPNYKKDGVGGQSNSQNSQIVRKPTFDSATIHGGSGGPAQQPATAYIYHPSYFSSQSPPAGRASGHQMHEIPRRHIHPDSFDSVQQGHQQAQIFPSSSPPLPPQIWDYSHIDPSLLMEP